MKTKLLTIALLGFCLLPSCSVLEDPATPSKVIQTINTWWKPKAPAK